MSEVLSLKSLFISK